MNAEVLGKIVHSLKGLDGVHRDCKIWIGCRDSEGYGKKRVEGKL